MTNKFCLYVEKIFDLSGFLATLRDSRKRPAIPLSSIWLSGFFMFATRRGSLNAIDGELRAPKIFEKLVGKRKPSGDRIGEVFSIVDPAPLRRMLGGMGQKLKRLKALVNSWPLRFAALDGHESFSSRSRCCDQCLKRTITVNGKKVTEYYHRVVVCHLIGYEIALPLDAELLRPGEDEIAAAERLLERVLTCFPRFFDAVVGDALYNRASFINLCNKHNKGFVAVLKENNEALLRDAEGLTKISRPISWENENTKVKAWDMQGFERTNVTTPLRVLYVEETTTKRKRVAGKWRTETQTTTWAWVTNIPKTKLSTRMLWLAAHRRWDIENDLFNVLSTHYALDHCFKHHPVAILNFTLTLFIAFIMLQCFYHRNLKQQLKKKLRLTLIALTHKLYQGLADPELRAPWLHLTTNLPPPT